MMNTTAKQNRNRDTVELAPELIEIYRAYPAVDVGGAARGMSDFLAHRSLFEALGATEMAAAAERAWWQDAVILAAEPTETADQARAKIEALRPALDGRRWRTAGDGLRAMAAMVTVAVELERQRFGLHTPTRH